MADRELKKNSKFLSLILRHRPETIGLTVDKQGWANTGELLQRLRDHGVSMSLEQLQELVSNNDKKRFAFSQDLSKIRASQGHSLSVELELKDKEPPEILYHGTARKNLQAIMTIGLLKGQRHHVHLSADKVTARKVGQRYGKPVILNVHSGQMYRRGIKFYQSENGVWLTDYVAAGFLTLNADQNFEINNQ